MMSNIFWFLFLIFSSLWGRSGGLCPAYGDFPILQFIFLFEMSLMVFLFFLLMVFLFSAYGDFPLLQFIFLFEMSLMVFLFLYNNISQLFKCPR